MLIQDIIRVMFVLIMSACVGAIIYEIVKIKLYSKKIKKSETSIEEIINKKREVAQERKMIGIRDHLRHNITNSYELKFVIRIYHGIYSHSTGDVLRWSLDEIKQAIDDLSDEYNSTKLKNNTTYVEHENGLYIHIDLT